MTRRVVPINSHDVHSRKKEVASDPRNLTFIGTMLLLLHLAFLALALTCF